MSITEIHQHALILAGQSVHTDSYATVANKFTGEPMAEVSMAGPSEIERAIAIGEQAAYECAAISPQRRAAILSEMAGMVRSRADEISATLAREAGKPIQAARVETDRCIATLTESSRVARAEFTSGELADRKVLLTPQGQKPKVHGTLRRVPIGLCSFITPFNFPLNLVAHKIGPAIACGCPFVLKPAGRTPLSALTLGEIALEAGWPEDAVSILPCKVEHAEPFSNDSRFRLLSFTGSDEVGWKLKSSAAKMRVALELGGDAAVVISGSTSAETRRNAANRIVAGAYGYAGQSCISVQRIVVFDEVYSEMRDLILDEIASLKSGDPMHPDTFIGPVIDSAAADRVESWLTEAIEAGATKLCGGERSGNTISPTLLEGVPSDCKLARQEVFGPVAYMVPVNTLDEAIRTVNLSRYGLQAGLYSENEDEIERAFRHLEVGALIVGDVPTFRTDPMPYGGVKDSGTGREGPLYAAEHMTELRLLARRDREGKA